MTLTLEEKATNNDTFRHIERVRNLLNRCVTDLLVRGERHDQRMISINGHSCYCCEFCNESYAYVHIREDGKLIWESSYVDTDDISVAELREEVTDACIKRSIDISKIEDFDKNYVGDWEYKECLDSQIQI